MFRQRLPLYGCFQSGNEALQYKRSLSGTGYAGDSGQFPFWNVGFQRFYRVDGRGGEVDSAIGKYISLLTLCSCCNVRVSCLYNAFVCIPGEEVRSWKMDF